LAHGSFDYACRGGFSDVFSKEFNACGNCFRCVQYDYGSRMAYDEYARPCDNRSRRGHMHDGNDNGCHYANGPKPEGEEKVKIKNVLILILVLIAGYGILITVAELPPYGMPDNPIHNEVYERYVNDALEDTGVPNTVTAVVLDYRAYDTMFETIVLFTAALAAVITLKSWNKAGDR
jgi:hypothetical protein